MADNSKSIRRKWTKDEVLGLLRCYDARKEEFTHPRKKKRAYENVLEDMIFQGITDSSTTASSLQIKIKSLIAAFKDARDDRNKTGAAPILVPYETELEEIFGNKPIISNAHTVHFGRKSETVLQASTSAVAKENLSPNSTQELETQEFTEYEALDDGEISESFISLMSLTTPPTLLTDLPSTSSTSTASRIQAQQNLSTTATATAPKRKTAREKYYEEKIKIKREAASAEKAQRDEFFQSIKEGMAQKWEREAVCNRLRVEIMRDVQKNLQN